MKCPFCAKDIFPGMRFCPHCGKLVTGNTTSAHSEEQLAEPVTQPITVPLSFDKSTLSFQDITIPDKKKQRNMILIIVAIIVLLAGAAVAYFLLLHPKAEVTQITKTIEAGTEIDPLTLIAVKNSENFDVTVKSSDLNTKRLGDYTIVYMVTPKKNTDGQEHAFVFTVQDTTPPQINAPATISILKDQKLNVIANITVTDNLDGIIDPATVAISGSPDITKKGTYPITLFVYDQAGNKATAEISVIVEDKSDPVAFFKQINYNWEFVDELEKMIVIRKEGNTYYMYTGYKESHCPGGAFVLEHISPDNLTATGTWMYVDKEYKEIPIKFDLGKPGDGKMKVDLGSGWRTVRIYDGN